MKSYTDLEQSKILSEIIPLESADICYKCIGEDPYDVVLRPYSEWKEEYKGLLVAKEVDVIPCWSLAALFDVLPEGIIENYHTPNLQKENGKYSIAYGNEELLCIADNPIDVCVEMVLKLRELNLL